MESLKSSQADAFASKAIVVPPSSSISETIGLLKNNDAYEVFVENGSRFGIVTVRDILKASDISNMKISSLASPISKISPTDTVAKVARLMSDFRLRALPIAKDNAIEGAITAESLCHALLMAKEFSSVAVNKIMKKNLVTINKDESVSKARSLMTKNGIDHLPVMDSGKLRGILLSSQIVFSMFPREKLRKGTLSIEPGGYADLKVSGLMDQNILTCAPEEKARTVLQRMIEQRKTYAVVKLWDELQGIVTYRDFVSLLAELEKLDVPAYIVGLPADPFEAHLAHVKFIKEARILFRSFPNIEEIRAAIKTKEMPSNKRRYEVSVSIRTPSKVHAYSENGWDLPLIFDSIGNKMKRLLTRKPEESLLKPLIQYSEIFAARKRLSCQKMVTLFIIWKQKKTSKRILKSCERSSARPRESIFSSKSSSMTIQR